jgi:thymidylate synthase
MNKLDLDYQNLLKDILENGVKKETRNGGTLSVFGRQIRHNMKDGFPLLTTKKMFFKGIVTELLWFLRGDTNIKYLVDNDCHIWDGDAYKNYMQQYNVVDAEEYSKGYEHQCWGYPVLDHVKPTTASYKRGQINAYLEGKADKPFFYLTKEEFINKIKTDDKFAKKWGELGPIYGKQWRSWGYREDLKLVDNNRGDFEYEKVITTGVDQIQNLINDLKTNSDSRRLMVSAWNVGELDQMVLPPCHFSFQCYSHEKEGKRYLSLAWNQRSCDVGLGIPFNITSYGLLLEIIAKEVGMIPYELIGNLGDCHIYNNHIDGLKEQLTREPFDLPKVLKKDEYHYLADMDIPFAEKIMEFKPDWFKLENYQSHPAIKLPLSN